MTQPIAVQPLSLRNQFTLTVRAPVDEALGYFGAHGERVWAGESWDPQFLHPVPAADQPGAVFLVPRGDRKAVGHTTIFDRARGHARHVFVMNHSYATVIDIRLTPIDAAATEVAVVYERTALDPAANDEVRRLSEVDADQGPEWEAAIEGARRGAS